MSDFDSISSSIEEMGRNRKRGGAAVMGLGIAAALAAFLGGIMLFVPWQNAGATSYAACHASPQEWLGCVAGMTPWLPFVLLAGGVGTLIVMAKAGGRR